MRKWSERRWWHYVPILSGFVLMAVIGIMLLGMFPRHVESLSIENGLGFAMTVFGVLGTIFWLLQCNEYTKNADYNEAFALIEKKSGRVVRAELQRVRLIPWPFRTCYETKKYPTGFWFSTAVHPISINPKVIPLSVRLGVALEGHGEIPDWFLRYLLNPAAENIFKRHVFNILQHELPQELANRLNPFDNVTVDELKGYVGRQLCEVLPFPIRVERMEIAMKN